MHPKRLLGLAGVIIAAAFLITSAGAGTSATPHFNLSTQAGVAKYLKSIGVSPKGVVIQRGLRNYAGPSCPGARWHCTRARHVFQIAAAGGDNKVDCTPVASEPFDQSCQVTQSNDNGNNSATCREGLDQTPSAAQECVITQTNINGDNNAKVDQKINQKDGSSQTAMQTSQVDQTNTAGKNDAKVSQDVDQDTHGAVDQSQEADQSSCVKQHDPANLQGACDDTTAVGTATGNDSSDVKQSVDQGEHAGNAVVELNQGSTMSGHVSQDTTGLPKNHNDQHEHQNAEGKNAFVSQSGPMHCCTTQGSSPKAKFDIHQDSDQHTNAAGFNQDESIIGECMTSGQCHVDQNANENGEHAKNMCDSNTCGVGIVCSSSSGGEAPTTFGACVPCTFNGETCTTGCIEGCFVTASLSRLTARPAMRPQAVRLLRRSALLH